MARADTASGAARREDSVRTSLQDLQRIEDERLQREAEAERAAAAAAERERAEAEQRAREEATERARQVEAAAAARRRDEATAAERARLLDVNRRVADRERELRAQFDGELDRIRTQRPLRRWDALLSISVAGLALMVIVGWLLLQRMHREIETQRSLAAATERTRCAAQLRPLQLTLEAQGARIAHLDRELAGTHDRASRAEARALALDHTGKRPRTIHAPPTPTAPKHPEQIHVDTSDDPLGGLRH